MRRTVAMLCLSLGLIGFATGVAAADEGFVSKKRLQPEQFPQLVELLRVEMSPGGRFEFVEDRERDSVEAELARMGELLAGRRSLDELQENEKVALINAQEAVNAILTRRDRDRLICQRRAVVGSHMKQTVCETYGEQIARKRAGQDRYRELSDMNTVCSGRTGECNPRSGPIAGGGN